MEKSSYKLVVWDIDDKHDKYMLYCAILRCVCVRERERERERVSVCVCVCVCSCGSFVYSSIKTFTCCLRKLQSSELCATVFVYVCVIYSFPEISVEKHRCVCVCVCVCVGLS